MSASASCAFGGIGRSIVASATVLLLLCAAQTASAQVIPDSTRRDSTDVSPPPSLMPLQLDSATTRSLRSRLQPSPLTARRAFLYSFFVPGLAQSRLQRTTSGALFVTVEMGSLAMLRRSMNDVREVRRVSGDSVPSNFTVNSSTGVITAAGVLTPRFDDGLERTRQLHVEDWIAALAFNHLISAADAFVAAQLFDVPAPTRISVVPSPTGWWLTASIQW